MSLFTNLQKQKYRYMKLLLTIFSILLTSLIIFSCSFFGESSKSEQSGTNDSDKGTVQLFNGENLDGWYTFIKDKGRDNDPNKVFTVQNGMIRISGEEYGGITTNDEYNNYKLVVEFKWGEITFAPRTDKAKDSGILLHSQGKDGGYSGTWMHSIECQLIEGGTGDIIVVGDGTTNFSVTSPVAPEKQNGSYIYKPNGELVTLNRGRINWYGRDANWEDVIGFRGANDVENPVGEWNRIECHARGEEIQIYLNDKLVNHAVKAQPTKGRIQIQSEGAELFVRRVELIPL